MSLRSSTSIISTLSRSIFFTPSFIIVELGFLLSSLVAAYELFIGDFVWAREEEERRRTTQKSRGRGIVPGQRQLYHPTQRPYHRSLSPGRGGRGISRGHGATEDETSSLLHGRRSSRRLNESAFSEEGSFPSPGDMRSVEMGIGVPGRGGSAGDSTRRLFYKLILGSLLARLLLLPIEFYCFECLDRDNSGLLKVPLQILLRTSQTFPDIVFASSLGLLVIFCAQVAFAALPPLSPNLSDASDDDEVVPTNEILIGDSIDEETEEGVVIDTRRRQENKQKGKRHITSTICTAISRFLKIALASKWTFLLWNVVVLTAYSTIFVVISAKNGVPTSQGEMYLWILLTTVYVSLIVALLYVGTLLMKALRPGLKRRKDSNALAARLLGTCALLAWIFLERIIGFGTVAHWAFVDRTSGGNGEQKLSSYRKDAIQYGISELLPVLCLLFIMHRRRRGDMPSDVLIIHSFMNNLFGSMGVLSASEDEHPDVTTLSSDMGTVSNSDISTMGSSRRFQSYGGMLHDTFAPSRSGGVGTGRATASCGPPLHPRA
ncbi:hypothetical protein HJC23_000389 [Cyclotella cryptica]|uniref:THH1/TOM1/TOM3 domain-containing protein n=1 Tax=Cyclotella cryptica TaxID=29204 RepID=A0ABD3PJC0_9STRA|eukprot:CCRYP_014136-RA/>CCRYP_014136-RA protein AED:0.02 eAED:0.02 QI:194/1/1/1/1/1/2/166/546